MADNKSILGKLPIGLIGFVIAQSVGIIWWAAKIDHKVNCYEKHVEEIPKIRERVQSMLEEINQLEERIYGK